MTESGNRPTFRILVVEDNDTLREGMTAVLQKEGYNVRAESDGSAALKKFEEKPADLVITDFRMAGMDGLELLTRIKSKRPETEVMLVTAFGTVDLAVEAMKAGAWDFLPKPFSGDALRLKADRMFRIVSERRAASRLADENLYLRDEFVGRVGENGIVGRSDRMRAVFEDIRKIASSESSVLVFGESGTGKELVARAIHEGSGRSAGPFIRVACGALAEGILESELFGHEKGAFTGAIRQKRGRFELADRGTLFLDEIGDITPSTQVKMLRVLQEREFERVGGEETIRVDVRIIAATHRDLQADVRAGRFREDLYYRLHILPVHLPPLRERREDIPLLADHIIRKLSSEMRKPGAVLTESGVRILESYDWPGNVRELENVLERALVLSENSRIDAENLSFLAAGPGGMDVAKEGMDLDTTLEAVEKRLLEQAMTLSGGVKARAAKLLNIKESALYYKLEKYGLISRSGSP
jgi:two-component system, NtrC family, response regulator HydG